MKKPLATVPALLALLLAFGAQAQNTTAPTTGTGSSMTGGLAAPAATSGTGTRSTEARKDDAVRRGDRRFVEKAVAGGMFEVQISQLAASKATDPQVKSFANMLVDHHTAANSELVQLANSLRIELPAVPPRSMRREVEKLGKKNGAEFDRDFVRRVGIKAHEQDIKLFQHASKDVKDPRVKAWVDKTLPTLQSHLQQAQALPQSGKDTSAMGNKGR